MAVDILTATMQYENDRQSLLNSSREVEKTYERTLDKVTRQEIDLRVKEMKLNQNVIPQLKAELERGLSNVRIGGQLGGLFGGAAGGIAGLIPGLGPLVTGISVLTRGIGTLKSTFDRFSAQQQQATAVAQARAAAPPPRISPAQALRAGLPIGFTASELEIKRLRARLERGLKDIVLEDVQADLDKVELLRPDRIRGGIRDAGRTFGNEAAGALALGFFPALAAFFGSRVAIGPEPPEKPEEPQRPVRPDIPRAQQPVYEQLEIREPELRLTPQQLAYQATVQQNVDNLQAYINGLESELGRIGDSIVERQTDIAIQEQRLHRADYAGGAISHEGVEEELRRLRSEEAHFVQSRQEYRAQLQQARTDLAEIQNDAQLREILHQRERIDLIEANNKGIDARNRERELRNEQRDAEYQQAREQESEAQRRANEADRRYNEQIKVYNERDLPAYRQRLTEHEEELARRAHRGYLIYYDELKQKTGEAYDGLKRYFTAEQRALRSAQGRTWRSDLSNFWKNLAGNFKLLAAGTVVAVGAALGYAAIQAAKFAGQVEQVRRGFETLADQNAINPDDTLVQLRETSRGVLSDFQLLSLGARALSSPIAIIGENTNQILKDVGDVATLYGRDIGEAQERFIAAVQKQEVELLDELGIRIRSNDAYRQYAKEVGKTVQELNELERGTAFATLAMEKLNEVAERSGRQFSGADNNWSNASIAFQQLGAEWKNLSAAFGEFASSFIAVGAQVARYSLKITTYLIENWASTIAASREYAEEFRKIQQTEVQDRIGYERTEDAGFLDITGDFFSDIYTGRRGVGDSIARYWRRFWEGFREGTQEYSTFSEGVDAYFTIYDSVELERGREELEKRRNLYLDIDSILTEMTKESQEQYLTDLGHAEVASIIVETYRKQHLEVSLLVDAQERARKKIEETGATGRQALAILLQELRAGEKAAKDYYDRVNDLLKLPISQAGVPGQNLIQVDIHQGTVADYEAVEKVVAAYEEMKDSLSALTDPAEVAKLQKYYRVLYDGLTPLQKVLAEFDISGLEELGDSIKDAAIAAREAKLDELLRGDAIAQAGASLIPDLLTDPFKGGKLEKDAEELRKLIKEAENLPTLFKYSFGSFTQAQIDDAREGFEKNLDAYIAFRQKIQRFEYLGLGYEDAKLFAISFGSDIQANVERFVDEDKAQRYLEQIQRDTPKLLEDLGYKQETINKVMEAMIPTTEDLTAGFSAMKSAMADILADIALGEFSWRSFWRTIVRDITRQGTGAQEGGIFQELVSIINSLLGGGSGKDEKKSLTGGTYSGAQYNTQINFGIRNPLHQRSEEAAARLWLKWASGGNPP